MQDISTGLMNNEFTMLCENNYASTAFLYWLKRRDMSFTKCVEEISKDSGINSAIFTALLNSKGSNKQKLSCATSYLSASFLSTIAKDVFCLIETLMKDQLIDLQNPEFVAYVNSLKSRAIIASNEEITNYNFIKAVRNAFGHNDLTNSFGVVNIIDDGEGKAMYEIKTDNALIHLTVSDLVDLAKALNSAVKENLFMYEISERRLENAVLKKRFDANNMQRYISLNGEPIVFDEFQRKAFEGYIASGTTAVDEANLFLNKGVGEILEKRHQFKENIDLPQSAKNLLVQLYALRKGEVTQDGFILNGNSKKQLRHVYPVLSNSGCALIALSTSDMVTTYLPSTNNIVGLLTQKLYLMWLALNTDLSPSKSVEDFEQIVKTKPELQSTFPSFAYFSNSKACEFTLVTTMLRNVFANYDLSTLSAFEVLCDTQNLHHVRNALMHGTYYYNFNDGIEIYDGQRRLKHICTLNSLKSIRECINIFATDQCLTNVEKHTGKNLFAE